MTGNIKKISEAVKASGADAILITSAQNRYYATGFRSSAGELVIAASGDAALFIDARYFEEASSKITGAQVIRTRTNAPSTDQVNEYIEKLGIRKLEVEDGELSYTKYMDYENKLSAELVSGTKLLDELRAVKSREELDIMIKAQRIAEKSYNELLSVLSPDMTEKEVAAELTCRMLKNGAEDKSFDPIIVSGSLSSVPHGKPRDIKLQRGFLTMDFGALYQGYCSDTTRTVCIGEPTEEMARVYDTVLKAQLAAIAGAKAGMKGRDIDAIARNVITDAGYGEYFSHSLSHSLGINIHEEPRCSPFTEAVIPSGCVISMEPGIYIPGKFGVRIEDVVYVTENGCEDITDLPKELSVICD
ncbi:MAG: M24 family metallopeptidase [Oscillospiraceae bacterium]